MKTDKISSFTLGRYTPILSSLYRVNFVSIDNEKPAYIDCADFKMCEKFVSKIDGSVISEEDLSKKFVEYIEKNCLEIIYDYESGNQTGTKEHPYNVIIPMFEEDVLNCEGYKLSSTNMRRIMQNSYINWLHYAADYGGLSYDGEE
jgi:hypothetical protein